MIQNVLRTWKVILIVPNTYANRHTQPNWSIRSEGSENSIPAGKKTNRRSYYTRKVIKYPARQQAEYCDGSISEVFP